MTGRPLFHNASFLDNSQNQAARNTVHEQEHARHKNQASKSLFGAPKTPERREASYSDAQKATGGAGGPGLSSQR